MNVVCLMGRLTADPEVRQTPNGISVCSFSIAVDRFSNGERKADFIKTPLLSLASMTPTILIQFNDAPP